MYFLNWRKEKAYLAFILTVIMVIGTIVSKEPWKEITIDLSEDVLEPKSVVQINCTFHVPDSSIVMLLLQWGGHSIVRLVRATGLLLVPTKYQSQVNITNNRAEGRNWFTTDVIIPTCLDMREDDFFNFNCVIFYNATTGNTVVINNVADVKYFKLKTDAKPVITIQKIEVQGDFITIPHNGEYELACSVTNSVSPFWNIFSIIVNGVNKFYNKREPPTNDECYYIEDDQIYMENLTTSDNIIIGCFVQFWDDNSTSAQTCKMSQALFAITAKPVITVQDASSEASSTLNISRAGIYTIGCSILNDTSGFELIINIFVNGKLNSYKYNGTRGIDCIYYLETEIEQNIEPSDIIVIGCMSSHGNGNKMLECKASQAKVKPVVTLQDEEVGNHITIPRNGIYNVGCSIVNATDGFNNTINIIVNGTKILEKTFVATRDDNCFYHSTIFVEQTFTTFNIIQVKCIGNFGNSEEVVVQRKTPVRKDVLLERITGENDGEDVSKITDGEDVSERDGEDVYETDGEDGSERDERKDKGKPSAGSSLPTILGITTPILLVIGVLSILCLKKRGYIFKAKTETETKTETTPETKTETNTETKSKEA